MGNLGEATNTFTLRMIQAYPVQYLALILSVYFYLKIVGFLLPNGICLGFMFKFREN